MKVVEETNLEEQTDKQLASLVALVASADSTEPDQSGSGWRTAFLLKRIKRLVIDQRGQSVAYAEIIRQALLLIQEDGISETVRLALGSAPVDFAKIAESQKGNLVLLRIAELDGEWRLAPTSERELAVRRMITSLQQAVDSLRSGKRKEKCEFLLFDYSSRFFDHYGFFAEAAARQSLAVQVADRFGDKVGAAVCRFMEVVSLLKNALLLGDQDLSIVYFSALKMRYDELVQATDGSPIEVQQADGAICMIKMSLLLDTPIETEDARKAWDSWVATALAAVQERGGGWQAATEFVRVADLVKKKAKSDTTDKLATIAADERESSEARALALLCQARWVLAWGVHPGLAKEAQAIARDLVAKMSLLLPGAQHVLAVGQRNDAVERVSQRLGGWFVINE